MFVVCLEESNLSFMAERQTLITEANRGVLCALMPRNFSILIYVIGENKVRFVLETDYNNNHGIIAI